MRESKKRGREGGRRKERKEGGKRGREGGRERGRKEGRKASERGEGHNQSDSLGRRVCAHRFLLFIANIGILFAQQTNQKQNKTKRRRNTQNPDCWDSWVSLLPLWRISRSKRWSDRCVKGLFCLHNTAQLVQSLGFCFLFPRFDWLP